MAEGNGNGSNGDGEKVVKNVAMMPGRNGGMLRRGGPIHAGPGRPRSAVRNMLLDEFAAQIPQLKKDLKAGKISRLDFANLCARYGLGTTVTETDTEGNDAPRPQVIAYIPDNGRVGNR